MKPLIIGGHSLGAGRAVVLSALAAAAGRPPLAYVGFGEPKPGYASLGTALFKAGCRLLPHCNGDDDGHDLVTDVPFRIPPGFLYCNSSQLIRVAGKPTDNDPWALFRYHHMPLYVIGTKLEPRSLVGDITTNIIAEYCNGIYAYPGDAPIAWDHFDSGADSDGICWGFKSLPEADLVILRGSVTLEDWFRDFDQLAKPWNDSQLGPVHPGFLLGMRDVWNEVATLLPWPPSG